VSKLEEACKCPDWASGIESINASIQFAWVHGMVYCDKPFAYCPWCGAKLEDPREVVDGRQGSK